MPRPHETLDKLLATLPRPVALVGFGVEEGATLRFLQSHGIDEITVFDRNPQAAPPGVRFVSGSDWRDPAIQARYAGWFSSYLVRRIAALTAH